MNPAAKSDANSAGQAVGKTETKSNAKPDSQVDAQSDASSSAGRTTTIAWQPWTDDLFTQATREHKLVILDLEAVWCHWCHVMEEKTYHNPQVIREIQDHFIAVRVDQDSRPDISNRFEDFRLACNHSLR